MRLGLIGPGRMGKRYLMRVNGGERIGAVYARTVKAPVMVEPEVSPDYFLDLDHFFREELSGCIIATPPASHRELAIRAIEAGIPVLVEKPLALNWEDCSAIIDAAENRGVPLLVGHIHLFHRAFEILHQKTHTLTIRIGGPRGDHDYSALFDWGSHAVAMALQLADSRHPISWKVWPDSHDTWDIALNYRDRHQVIQIGSERVLSVEDGQTVLYTGQEPASQTPMANMVSVFQKLIEGGRDPRAELDFTRTVYGILCSVSGADKVN